MNFQKSTIEDGIAYAKIYFPEDFPPERERYLLSLNKNHARRQLAMMVRKRIGKCKDITHWVLKRVNESNMKSHKESFSENEFAYAMHNHKIDRPEFLVINE